MPWWRDLLKQVLTPAPAPAQPPAKPRATLAFQVLNEFNTPIPTAFATLEGGLSKQANDDGYIAFELEVGIYNVKFEADDFRTIERRFQLEANRQFSVIMVSTKPVPQPVPVEPAPTPVPQPPAPPQNQPQRPPETDEEFHQAWLAILRKHGSPATVNLQTLIDTRADIEALGCQWQHTSDGTLRPRLFLPVRPGSDVYSRPFDMGLYGEPWQWIRRY